MRTYHIAVATAATLFPITCLAAVAIPEPGTLSLIAVAAAAAGAGGYLKNRKK